MQETISIGRHDFEYNKEHNFYECRGEVCYDDEHDEVPEPSLWKAAHELAKRLKEKGYSVNVEHSEKGWVEVDIEEKS
jgi:hypothetical protein